MTASVEPPPRNAVLLSISLDLQARPFLLRRRLRRRVPVDHQSHLDLEGHPS
jgi:hypothetical protein